jgi:zinc protease
VRALAVAALIGCAMMAETVDRTKPPATPPLEAFRLPPLQEFRLANGLQVLLVNDARFPIVHVRLGFQAGSRFDPPQLTGLAETVAQLLKEGTETRSSRQFAEEVAAIGGTLEARATPDFVIVSGSALSEHTGKLLDLLADMTRHANFPEEEVQLRKQNRKQELAHERSQPGVLADEKLSQVVFGAHPYSRTLPTEESIDQIGREDLLSFRSAFLRPNNAILVLAGPLGDRKTITREVEGRFGKWERKDVPAAANPELPDPKRVLVLVNRPDSVQADIRAGRWAVERTHPDYFPLVVTHTIFGAGASSRMFKIIREQMGFGYDAHSELEPRRNFGLFTAVSQVRNEVVDDALDAVLAQLLRIGEEPVSGEELEAAKNYLAGIFAIGLETPSALAGQLLSVRLNNLPKDYLETYVPRLRAVTADQIRAVAAKYLNPEALAIVLVGDAARIGERLQKFGKLQIEQARP